MSEAAEATPVKQRGRKGAGRRATRSTAKPGKAAAAADEDAAIEQQEEQLLTSEPSQMQSQPQQQEPATAASKRRRQPDATPPPQPATSSMTGNTARQSGRLGSRLTGTHAAIPAGSTVTERDQARQQAERWRSHVGFIRAYALQRSTTTNEFHNEQDDAAGEGEVNLEKRPGATQWTDTCHAADVATEHVQHAWQELRAGRVTPQVLQLDVSKCQAV